MAGIRASIQAELDTSKVDMQFNKMMSRLSGKQINFNVNSRSFTQPLGRITASANEFTKSLEASNARVIAFGASVGIINAVTNAFKGLVAETIRFEKTLADINVIMNASTSSIEKFGHSLFDVAKNTAQSFDKVADAALEFSRQGLSMEETLRRTNDALILTRLTSLKAEEAVAGLTAAVNAFGNAGLTTTDIIDKLAAVDVKFAVSSEDLINALERTGAVAIDAGVKLDNLIGLVTALQQTTARGGSVIGNGLKTIFTRIQRPASIKQLEDMNVAVRDLSGAVLPADKILTNIAKSFDTLSQAQQSNVVQFAAGIFQANVFRASLRDLAKEQSIFSKASQISANAAGEAALKNEQLNKTVSALASQSATAVRELAEVIGDLTLKPELGGFLSSFLNVVEGFKDALGGGEEEGSTFAKGLVRGIGNVLTGPALFAFGAVFIKMLANVSKFASQSLKDVLGITTRKEKIRQMEESIVNVLAENKHIQQGLNELEGDRLAQEKFLLKIIEAQTNAMAKQKTVAASLARPLLQAGVNPNLTSNRDGPIDLDGDGRIDTFSSGAVPSKSEKAREVAGAIAGGYAPGSVRKMNMPGLGKVVYNAAEKVKKFPGMDQPAIMPPKSSSAGKNYKDVFESKHGFDPYAHHGFVPNFANLSGSKLVMDKSRLNLFGNSVDIARAIGINYKDVEESFKNNQPITVQAGLQEIIKSSEKGKTQITGKESLFEAFSALAGAGVESIQRDFDIRQIPAGQKGKGKLSNEEFAERKTTNLLNREQEISGEEQTHRQTYDPKTKKGVQSYPVDIIAYGERFPSHEVKSGSFNAANLISKSLRMSSDRELSTWMSLNKISGGKKLAEKNLKGAKNLADKLGIKGTGEDDQFTQEDADIWGMSSGFIPNFKKLYRGTSGYPGSRATNVAGAYWDSPTNLYKDVIKRSMESWDKAAAASPAFPSLFKKKMDYGVDEYNINDSLFNQLRTGVYKAQNVIKLKKFVDNFDLDDIRHSDGIDEDFYDEAQEERGRAIDSIKREKGSKKIPGTASRPLPLIQELRKGIYSFPDLGPNSEYRDSLLKRDEDKIESLFDWKKTGERKLSPEFSDNRAFFEDMSIHGGDKALRASMFGGKAGLKQSMESSAGLIPNFEDIIKFERNKILAATPMHMEYFKSFQEGETEWRGGQSMKDFLASLYEDYKDQFKSMQEWLNALDGLQRGDLDVGMMTGSMSAHRAKNKNMSGGYVPNFASKLNYIELGKRILNYPGKLPIYEQLAEELSVVPGLESVKKSTLANLAGKSIFTKSTRNAFVNYYKNTKKPGRFGNPYTEQEAKNTLKEVGDKLRSTRQKGYAQQAGLDFEDSFRAHFTPPIPKPAGQPHMDFPAGTLDGLDPSQMSDIFLNTNTGGDAYKGIKGHPPEHFIAKYLRQKLDRGGKVFDFTSTLGSQLLDFALQKLSGSMNVNNAEGYTDILGIDLEGADRANQPVSASESLDSIFKHSLKLKEAIESRGKIKRPKQKKINFNYEKDYVQSLSGGFVPNYTYWRKFVQFSKSQDGQWGIKGDMSYLEDFINFLEKDGGNSQREIDKLTAQLEQLRTSRYKEKQALGYPSMGREGAKYYAKKSALSERPETLSLKGVFLKNLKDKIHEYNDRETRSKFKSEGFVPNFADPLRDAVSREMSAGLPLSKIRVERSDSLRGPKNPMGLAVTNTRDEPFGVQQGINRAKSMGIDPKKHGASQGLIPNFVSGAAVNKTDFSRFQRQADPVGPSIKAFNEYKQALEESTNKLKENTESTENSTSATDDRARGDFEGLQKLFYLQSAISMTNGFLQEFAAEGSGVTKKLAELGMGISNVTAAYIQQKQIIPEFLEALDQRGEKFEIGELFGKGPSEEQAKIRAENEAQRVAKGPGFLGKTMGKLGKFGDIAGKAGRMFGRLLPVVGQLYTGFTAFNEAVKFVTGEGIFDHMASSSEKAAKRLEELAEAADKVTAAQSSAMALEKNLAKISELESLGKNKTIAQEKELFDLKAKSYNLEAKRLSDLSKLADEDVMGEKGIAIVERELGSLANVTTATVEQVARINAALSEASLLEARIKNISDTIEDRSDGLSIDELSKAIGKDAFSIGQEGRTSFIPGAENMSPEELSEAQQEIVKEMERLSRTMRSGEQAFAAIDYSNLSGAAKEAVERLAGANDGLSMELKGLSSNELKLFKKSLSDLIKGFKTSNVKTEMEAIQQASANYKRELDRAVEVAKHRADIEEINLKSLIDGEKLNIQRNDIQNKFLQTSKAITESEARRLQIRNKLEEADLDFISKQEAARKKSLDSMLEQTSKNLRDSNITLSMDEGGFKAASKEFIGKIKTAGDGLGGEAFEESLSAFNEGLVGGSKIMTSELEEAAAFLREKFKNVDVGEDFEPKELQGELNKITNELIKSGDARKAAAVQLVLSEEGALKLSEEQKKKIRDILNEETKALHAAKKSRDTAEAKIKLEEEELILNGKTVESAKAKEKLLRQHPITMGTINAELLGEAANLRVMNDHHSRRLDLVRASEGFQEKIFENLRQQARDSAESGAFSLGEERQKLDLRGANPADLTKEQAEVQKNLIDISQQKIEGEIVAAGLAAEDAELRRQILSSHNNSNKIASATLKTETANLQADIGIKKARLDLLSDEVKRSELVSAMVSNEMLDARISLDILNERGKFLSQGKNRAKLASVQNKTEIKELNLSTALQKEKLKQLVDSGEISDLAREQIDAELTTLQYENSIAEEKLKQLTEEGKISDLASERLRGEITSLGTDLAYKEAKLKLLADEQKRSELISLTVRNEMADQEISLELLRARKQFLDIGQNRAKIADLQNKTELEQLELDNEMAKTKLQLSVSNGDLSKLAKEQVVQATISLERDALIASAKQKVLESTLGLEERQRKAQELLDVSNKMQELRNARNAANIDQGMLDTMVSADIDIDRFNKQRGMRQAATKATQTGKPEDVLAFAQAMKDFKDTTEEGSTALDALRVRMAEVAVSANESGAALVAGFDAARSEIKNGLKEIGSGKMSVGDAMEGVLLKSFGAAFDKMTEQNVDKFMNDIMFGLTGVSPEEDAAVSATKKNTEAVEGLTNSMLKLDRLREQLGGEVEGQIDKPENAITQKVNQIDKQPASMDTARKSVAGEGFNRGLTASICNCFDKSIQDNMQEKAKLQENTAQKIEQVLPQQDSQQTQQPQLVTLTEDKSAEEIKGLSTTMTGALGQMKDGVVGAIKQMGSMNPGGAVSSLISGLGGGLLSGIGAIGSGIAGLFSKGSGSGTAAKFYGGKIQKFNTGGLVQGPGGIDNVPAMLSAGEYVMSKQEVARATNLKNIAMARENSSKMDEKLYGDGIQKFNKGGKLENWAKGVVGGIEANGERSKALFGGIAGLGVQHAVANYVGKKYGPKQEEDFSDRPTFDNTRLETLNGGMGSTVSLGLNDSRLSGRFLAENQTTKDYGQYLLDVHEYDVAKNNAKVNAKLEKYKGFASSALGMVASSFMKNIGSIGGAIGGLVGKAGGMLGGGLSKIGGGLSKIPGIGKLLGSGVSGIGGAVGSLSSGAGGAIGALSNFNLSGAVSSLGSGMLGGASSLTGGLSQGASSIPGVGGGLSSLISGGGQALTGVGAGALGATTTLTNMATGRRKGFMSGLKDMGSSITGGLSAGVSGVSRGIKGALKTGDKDWRGRQGTKGFFMGGSVPAMLTKGESVIPSSIAQRMGYNNLNQINRTGELPIVDGPGGIDNVGPVGMDPGDFVIKRSSTEKLAKKNPYLMKMALQNPDVFRKGGMVKGYYRGGMVSGGMATSATPQNYSSMGANQPSTTADIGQARDTGNREASGATTNNINISVKIDQNGGEKVTTDAQGNDYQKEQELSMKIKTAVLQVIREEKRIGGELS